MQQKFDQTGRIIAQITGIIGDNLASIVQARWSLERSQEAAGQFELIGQEAGQTITAQNGKRLDVYQIYTAYSGSYKQVSANLERLRATFAMGVGGSFDVLAGRTRLCVEPSFNRLADRDGNALVVGRPPQAPPQV